MWFEAAESLARQFVTNFSKFKDCTDQRMLDNNIFLDEVCS